MKALHFNPFTDKEFREIETTFKVVDKFWIQTEHGPLIAGEAWKDSTQNRRLISEAIALNITKEKYENEHSKAIHRLMNQKEK